MTIRYKCEGCGSVLKIKDELAGTPGKCPKCKRKFVVPEPGHGAAEDSAITKSGELDSDAAPVESPAAVSTPAPVAAPAAKKSSGDGDDFDPVAFLMDDAAPGAKTSAGLASPPPQAPAANNKPAVDKQGRRHIAPPPPPTASPPPDAVAGGGGPLVSTSANARDLLTKTAGAIPEAAPRKVKLDLQALSAPLLQFGPWLAGAVVLAFGLYYMGDAVFTERLPLPRLAAVTGSVTLEGQPLKRVRVMLIPVSAQGLSTKGKPLKLRTAEGVTDESGYFEVVYLGNVKGAPLGKVRIGIEPLDIADYNKIPRKYLQPGAGGDIREVKEAANAGKFDLDLKKE
jgi:hypothetical protein